MACATCGLSAFDATGAAAWLMAMNRSLGFGGDITTWGVKQHVALWTKAAEVRSAIEEQYPDLAPAIDPGFGSNPVRTARLASIIALVSPSVRDAFWSMIGITKEQAVAQMVAQDGNYYAGLMSALAVIHESENPSLSAANDGPWAVGMLFLGSLATMVGLAGD